MGRVVFMGTPGFAVPCVEALVNHPNCELVAVVCQPDKLHGRHKTLQPPPVKAAAMASQIEVLQPRKLKSGPFLDELRNQRPDLIVVTAYGRILPRWILDLPTRGCINIHASLLPRWRGAAPIQWAIASGDKETGVCLMQMDEGLDTGPVFLERVVPIGPHDTAQDLHDRLSILGAQMLGESLDDLLLGRLTPTPQNDGPATYASMLTGEHGRIDWTLDARRVANHLRGFYPWPGSWTELVTPGQTRRLKLFPPADIIDAERAGDAAAGTISEVSRSGLIVACGRGAVRLCEVQFDNRKRMAAVDAFHGLRLDATAVLV